MGKFDKILICLNRYICCCFTNKYKFDSDNCTSYDPTYTEYSIYDARNYETNMKRVPYSNSQIPQTRRRKKYNEYPYKSYRQFESTWRT